ncbi:hypothetical protein MTO96_037256 [Rhipicephalus appendiculatus]
MPAGTEARTAECVAVHATHSTDAVGSCDEVAPKDDEKRGDDACADEDTETVNSKRYTAEDEEIAEKEAQEFRSGEENTDGCRMGARYNTKVGAGLDAVCEDAARRHSVGGWEEAADGAEACYHISPAQLAEFNIPRMRAVLAAGAVPSLDPGVCAASVASSASEGVLAKRPRRDVRLNKKLLAASKGSGCAIIALWTKSIINHLYFAVGRGAGNGDLAVAVWLSVLKHIQNKHQGHGALYSDCEHGDLEPRKWIHPGTDAYDRLHAILTPKRLLDDIRQMSPSVQTFSVESFHSLINRFAPKSYAFSHQGMFIRCALAALHYNENADREQAVTKDGELRWKIRHPKAKKGEPVITSVKAEPSFEAGLRVLPRDPSSEEGLRNTQAHAVDYRRYK